MRDGIHCRLSTLTLMTLLVVHWRLMNGVVMVTGRFHRRQERTLSSLASSSSSYSSSAANLTPIDVAEDAASPLSVESTSYSTSASFVQPPLFTFRDCGVNPDRPIRILNVSVNPHPIRTPGKVKLSALINITHQLPPTMSADLLVSKYFLGVPMKIPCFHNVGTCHYNDVCGLLESMFPTDEDCPRVLRRHRIPCRCPFQRGLLNLARYSFHVPPFTGIMQSLAAGEYDTRVRLYDQVDKRELGCLQLRFDLRKKRPRRHTIGQFSETTPLVNQR